MSSMNLQIGLLIYEDLNLESPKERLVDITKRWDRVSLDNVSSHQIVLQPMESKEITSSVRTIGADATTVFSLTPDSNYDGLWRLQHVSGAIPAFRGRVDLSSSATIAVQISRTSDRIAKLTISNSNLSGVQNGDTVRFEQGVMPQFTTVQEFKIVNKGANFVEFADNGQLTEDNSYSIDSSDDLIRILRNDSVSVNDTLRLRSPSSYVNKGDFAVVSVSDDYIEFFNPYGIEESFNHSVENEIFEYLFGLVMVSATDSVRITFGNDESFAITKMPQGDAIFVGTVECTKIRLTNGGYERTLITVVKGKKTFN